MFDTITFDMFVDLIKDQFTYGGKKYALTNNEQKESTDMLFDKHGKNWLIGTVDKYTYRYNNLARERDLLKIGTYMYLIWLKRGFFIMPFGVLTPIDTNIKIKNFYFTDFILNVKDYYSKVGEESLCFGTKDMKEISLILQDWSNYPQFDYIRAEQIYIIFYISYLEWLNNFSYKAGQDTDTNNKEDIKRTE